MREREEPLQGPLPQQYHDALRYFLAVNRFESLYARSRDWTDTELHEAKTNLDIVFSTIKYDPSPYNPIYDIGWLFRTFRLSHNKGVNRQHFVNESTEKFEQHTQWFADQIGQHGVDTDRIIGQLFWEATPFVQRKHPKLVQSIVRAVDEHFPVFQTGLSDHPSSYIDFFLFYFQFTYSTKKYKKALSVFENFLDTHPDRDFFHSLLSNYLLSNRDGVGIRYAREHILQAWIKKSYHINPDTLLNAWSSSSYRGRSHTHREFRTDELIKSLNIMDTLEQCYPGSVRYLNSAYGIHHFGRYPRSILLEQFEKRDQHDQHPYIVILYPYDDYNGAFYQNRTSMLELFDQAKNLGINVRIVEAHSDRDIIRRMNKLTRTHGKADGVLVGGHGSWFSVQFGPGGRDGSRVNLWNILHEESDIARQAAEKYLVPNASIVLNSCSTGKTGGFAQELSKYGFHVAAPISRTNITSLTLTREGDLVVLEPEYHNPQSKRRYKKGRRHNN